VLFWFSLPPNTKSTPGERSATGSIVFQSEGNDNARQQSSASSAKDSDSDITEIYSEQLSNVALAVLPPTPALTPGQSASDVGGTESATDLVAMLQQGAANKSGGGTGTGNVTVQLFGTNGTGTKFIYVFDRSASMQGRRIQRAKEELVKSLGSLDEFHQFNIIFYSGKGTERPWRPSGKLELATSANKENATRFVEGIVAEGSTWHFDPLKAALAHRPDVIFFLTDGETHDDLSPVQLRELTQINNRVGRGVQINVIQFGGGGFTDFPSRSLEQLATDNHGKYVYVNVSAWQ